MFLSLATGLASTMSILESVISLRPKAKDSGITIVVVGNCLPLHAAVHI